MQNYANIIKKTTTLQTSMKKEDVPGPGSYSPNNSSFIEPQGSG